MILSSITKRIKKFNCSLSLIFLANRKLTSTRFCLNNNNNPVKNKICLKLRIDKLKKVLISEEKIKKNVLEDIPKLHHKLTGLKKTESGYIYSIDVQNKKREVMVFLLGKVSLKDVIFSSINIKFANFISLFLISNATIVAKQNKSFISYISLKNLKQFYSFFKNILTSNLYLNLKCYYYQNKLYIIQQENLNLLQYQKNLLDQIEDLKSINQSLINTFFEQYKRDKILEDACIEKHPTFYPLFHNFVAIVIVNCSLEKLKIIFYNFRSKIVSYFLQKLRSFFFFLMFIIILIITFFF